MLQPVFYGERQVDEAGDGGDELEVVAADSSGNRRAALSKPAAKPVSMS